MAKPPVFANFLNKIAKILKIFGKIEKLKSRDTCFRNKQLDQPKLNGCQWLEKQAFQAIGSHSVLAGPIAYP